MWKEEVPDNDRIYKEALLGTGCMHEFTIAREIARVAIETGRENDLARVTRVTIRVGAFGHVVPESLTFCFEICTKDTIAEGAFLELHTVPMTYRCTDCEKEVPIENYDFVCPECGGKNLEFVGGDELCIETIQGEQSDDGD